MPRAECQCQTSAVTVFMGLWMNGQELQQANQNNSAQVRDARLDALSKDGALMSLTYGSLDA